VREREKREMVVVERAGARAAADARFPVLFLFLQTGTRSSSRTRRPGPLL
jgi:hypothetical protein